MLIFIYCIFRYIKKIVFNFDFLSGLHLLASNREDLEVGSVQLMWAAP